MAGTRSGHWGHRPLAGQLPRGSPRGGRGLRSRFSLQIGAGRLGVLDVYRGSPGVLSTEVPRHHEPEPHTGEFDIDLVLRADYSKARVHSAGPSGDDATKPAPVDFTTPPAAPPHKCGCSTRACLVSHASCQSTIEARTMLPR